MSKKASVTVHPLESPHQKESFTKFLPLDDKLKEEVFTAVREIFDAAGGKSLLKSSGDVYLKPNGVCCKAYSYTRPELIEAVIVYWKDKGARNIYLFENSTQANITRMVFAITGYSEICHRLGVKQVFLDEEKNQTLHFTGKDLEAHVEDGYRQASFQMPTFVVERLIEGRDENLYINLPKLKTHSMTDVTLGIKNQWGFPQHKDRQKDHNYNLHHKLTDMLGLVRPDFTLIEGIEGTVHGHYPVTAFADTCVIPFKVLIGSKNVVAADMVGTRLFGLEPRDVSHIDLAIQGGFGDGINSLEDIEIVGDISEFNQVYQADLLQRFPEDVRIIRGQELLCREGCQNNPLTLLQIFAYDHGGRGGWTMIMGKGHHPEEVKSITGKVLVVGQCAIAELGQSLVERLGRRNIYFSNHCNDLGASICAMAHLMKVSPLKLVPHPPHAAAKILLIAKLKGTSSKVPHLLANIIKVV